jgi:recombination protein RecT
MSNIQVIEDDLRALQPTFERVAVDTSINFEREFGFAMQILSGNDYLVKVALANRQSLADAITNVSSLGVSLNPAKKQAYLVPRKGKICLDVSYMGLVHLATMSGSIQWAQAKIVRRGETFRLHGYDKSPTHESDPFSESPGDIVGVYVVAKTSSGDFLTHTMRISEVYDIRDRSEAWKGYQAKGTKCPWVTDEGEMIKKTCVKQASKYWPVTERLDNAVHYLNTDGDEGLEFAPAAEAAPEGRKPEVKMPQSRSAKPVDIQDVDPRPAKPVYEEAKPVAKPAAKPAASNSAPATVGEIAWARRKVAALEPSIQAQLEGQGFNISGDLEGLTKGDFERLRKELV